MVTRKPTLRSSTTPGSSQFQRSAARLAALTACTTPLLWLLLAGLAEAQLRPTLLRSPGASEASGDRFYERRGLRLTADSRDRFVTRGSGGDRPDTFRDDGFGRRLDAGDDRDTQLRTRTVGRTRTAPVRPNLDVTKGTGSLPNDHGQVWREYNLRPYTSRVEAEDPEYAVLDWIRRETGDDVWNTGALSVLWANADKLIVYHTPEVQRTVANLIDRFMAGAAEKWDLSTRLITLKSPNWRARALPLLEPVNARSPGVDAWLMSKENAVVLLAQLRNRTDFSEHYAMHQPLDTGQSHKIQRYRDRDYVRSVRWAHRQFGAVRPERDAIAEGYTLQISPLFDPADRLIDAVVKCQIDQVEQFVPVTLTVNGANNQKQRVNIEVPQIVSWRLHERFVWPQDKVLLLSCGVVAAPTKDSKGRFPLPTANGRADALLFIQSNGTVGEALRGLERGDRTARQPGGFNRRY